MKYNPIQTEIIEKQKSKIGVCAVPFSHVFVSLINEINLLFMKSVAIWIIWSPPLYCNLFYTSVFIPSKKDILHQL